MRRFVVAYGTAFGLWGLLRHDRRVYPYLVVLLVLGRAVVAVDRRVGLPRRQLQGFALLGLLHLIGGLVPVGGAAIAYEAWLVPGVLRFDQAVHAYGCGLLTVVLFGLLRRWLSPAAQGGAVHGALAALGALGFGALNEVAEYLSALRLPDARIGDLANTGWDLVFNTAGAVAVACFLVLSGAASAPGGATASAGDRSTAQLTPEPVA